MHVPLLGDVNEMVGHEPNVLLLVDALATEELFTSIDEQRVLLDIKVWKIELVESWGSLIVATVPPSSCCRDCGGMHQNRGLAAQSRASAPRKRW